MNIEVIDRSTTYTIQGVWYRALRRLHSVDGGGAPVNFSRRRFVIGPKDSTVDWRGRLFSIFLCFSCLEDLNPREAALLY